MIISIITCVFLFILNCVIERQNRQLKKEIIELRKGSDTDAGDRDKKSAFVCDDDD